MDNSNNTNEKYNTEEQKEYMRTKNSTTTPSKDKKYLSRHSKVLLMSKAMREFAKERIAELKNLPPDTSGKAK